MHLLVAFVTATIVLIAGAMPAHAAVLGLSSDAYVQVRAYHYDETRRFEAGWSRGVDAVAAGGRVRAPAAGRVRFAGTVAGRGVVTIDSEVDGEVVVVTLTGLRSIDVQVGQRIEVGDEVGAGVLVHVGAYDPDRRSRYLPVVVHEDASALDGSDTSMSSVLVERITALVRGDHRSAAPSMGSGTLGMPEAVGGALVTGARRSLVVPHHPMPAGAMHTSIGQRGVAAGVAAALEAVIDSTQGERLSADHGDAMSRIDLMGVRRTTFIARRASLDAQARAMRGSNTHAAGGAAHARREDLEQWRTGVVVARGGEDRFTGEQQGTQQHRHEQQVAGIIAAGIGGLGVIGSMLVLWWRRRRRVRVRLRRRVTIHPPLDPLLPARPNPPEPPPMPLAEQVDRALESGTTEELVTTGRIHTPEHA